MPPLSTNDLKLLTDPPDLAAELTRLLRQIPAGRVASFGDLAEALGDLSAARWVATELQQVDSEEFPIHRVVRRTGKIVGTAACCVERRVVRLHSEGVPVKDSTVDWKSFGWQQFVGAKPLAKLQALQTRIAGSVIFPALDELPERLAGVDVSYPTADTGVAAYAVVETRTGRLLDHELYAGEVRFPYIPGYLSFRELPLYRELLDRVRRTGRLESWVLVDGNGILHPRRAGIATLLGSALSVRTVGVSKHLLCGAVADRASSPSEIRAVDGELLGYCLSRGTKRRTLYVSPGAGVDAAGALRLATAVLCSQRLPEPLYHADRLSRAAARRR